MVEIWYLNPVSVSLSTSESGAVIRYTTDGTEPTATSPAYSEPLHFTVTTLLKCKTFVGTVGSHARAAYYRVAPGRTNMPPLVEAEVLPFVSNYAEFVWPHNEFGLYGRAQDSTYPNPPGQLTTGWSVVAAPPGATVSFENSGHPRTVATVSHPGRYTLRLTASDGELQSMGDVTVVVWPGDLLGVRHQIPGRIDAENYKAGGEGVGYHNIYGHGDVLYRNNPVSPVDAETAWNNDFGFALTELTPGEWTAYDVEVREAGYYRLNLSVAGVFEGGVVHIELDGQDISGPLLIPSNGVGGYRLFQLLTVVTPLLQAGQHELRLVVDQASVLGQQLNAAIDFLEFVQMNGDSTAPAAPKSLRIKTSP